jgi:ribose/xylose/arabinose/galactoside ABC-type transport system permease subunit
VGRQSQEVKRAWLTGNLALHLLRTDYLVLILSLIYFAALWPFTPGLASAANLENILSSLLPLLILGIGQTFVLVSGGIDLSVTSIVALASITGAGLMNGDTGWLRGSSLAVPMAVLTMASLGTVLGAANGLAITRFRMPAFIVTLTTMMFFSGFAIWLTRSRNIGNLPASFNALGARTSIALAITAVLAFLAHVVLSRGLLGRWLYAVGHNPRAARISGVPVSGVTVGAYAISGLCAAVASILYTGRLETGSPVLGQRILLDVIGATVIGGTSLYGGRGKVAWTLFGALFLTILDNTLNLLNLSFFTIMMAKGAVILLAAIIDTARLRWLSPPRA